MNAVFQYVRPLKYVEAAEYLALQPKFKEENMKAHIANESERNIKQIGSSSIAARRGGDYAKQYFDEDFMYLTTIPGRRSRSNVIKGPKQKDRNRKKGSMIENTLD